MEGVNASIKKGPGLYEFLVEAELQHYFNSFKNTLKIAHPSQLKFTAESDLIEIGMSKPEMRRLRKYYDKHFPHNYLSKLKKIINYKKQGQSSNDAYLLMNMDSLSVSRAPRVSSKHIIPAASITINKELGMGEFGVVQQGVWCNEGERIQVAIKCLSRDRMQSNMVEFLKEASIMHNIDHPNIVRFFGVVLPNVEGSLMLVTELAPLRSLLECLKEPSLRSSFPVLTLCDFAYQICDGMQYLEANRLIHRDLAARNILVFSKSKVKISDFGLSRALGQGKDYYQTNFNVNLKLPIAWCAPECISYLRFTTSSDVWAFGVTLWEMFSYGFQPWAALTGQQILEAIDEPNFQRLEQPDCCPLDHYNLMLDCWRHEASARPKFAEIGPVLAECRPEQVQAKASAGEGPHMLSFRVGDVITVLDKKSVPKNLNQNFKRYFRTHHPLWKGVTASGKTGLFDPINVVAYLGSDLPSSSFLRTDSTRSSSRKKLRSEMISAPQGDLKHTGHVGLDGAYFGDLSFLGGSKGSYGSVPTQVVAPYRPHKDLEAAPLLEGDHVPAPAPLQDHEYHEISDEENTHSPHLDLGPSLMAEMELMLNSFGHPNQALDHEGSNRSNELREKLGTKSRKQATIKPISTHDQKTLDTAIALANELSTRSMSAPAPTTPASPNKKKFSFRFPSVGEHDKNTERRNFSEEALSTSDLQSKVTQEAEMAYKQLVESPSADVTQLMVTNPLRILRSGQPVINPRTRSASVASTLPPKFHESVRNSVPENLNGTKTDLSVEEAPRQNFNTLPHPHRDDNPIPLPPRDRNKTLLAAKPRHTRKHPLIIPPSNLQRTLDKINTVTPPATVTVEPFPVYSNSVTQMAEKNPESIHFEAQIESDLNALDEIPQELDVVDGRVDEEKLSSHHVSCEDLLKFANTKPSSRARGIDSDEVRIMLKVLGKDVSKEKCVDALDQCEWEVMKAIKIVKLQNMVGAEMSVCCKALENSAWDVAKAAQWVLQQDEVTQV
ncbi:activated Cdc42 kinase-like isoform X2 [Tribolium castaneum]|uniref:activated Cdc42 kinase-like isoform X2 n=1 Tax=Tribolium castaneum TaxID=7070 RepID=UPI00046BEE0C|nr:PREDICTED: tyrosine-protein kinase PR2 isoform X2 [Tribolium castaneum]|eukprot:XP_008194423.1 PREDICTED: tyrosine-protein kinase PR2 isoform X2 [Tribolium castaneum]